MRAAALACLLASAAWGQPDDFMIQMDPKGDGWTQVVLNDGNKKLTYQFGPLGRQVVDLHRALGRNASLAEVTARVDALYGTDSSAGHMPSGGPGPGQVLSSDDLHVPTGGNDDRSMGRNAYSELVRARGLLTRGDFTAARGHLVLVEAALPHMRADVRKAYEDELWAVREAYSLPAAKESLAKLARAARRNDPGGRRLFTDQFEWWGRHLVDLKTGKPVDRKRLDAISREVWSAYGKRVAAQGAPKPGAEGDGVRGRGAGRGTGGRLLEEEELSWWERLKRWLASLTS